MAITRKGFNTSAVLKNVYPLVEKAMNTHKNQWLKCMSKFMSARSEMLFDTMPCDRIVFSKDDEDELFKALNLSQREVENGLHDTYYWNITPFKPSSAKDPLTIVALCIIRYFLIKNDKKNLSLALVYNSFSGKYYPSIHYGFFQVVTPAKYRHIMEYVVNYKLTQKFELKSTGSVIGAITVTHNTWLNSYKKMILSFDDEDITYVIQQLHNRIKSFMKNIAAVYYKTYENKDYISYDKDEIPEEEGGSGNYHLADNDAFKLQRYVENTMSRLSVSQIDYKTCKMCADANVKTEEVRSIFEAIFNDQKNNADLIKEYVTDMIASYMAQATGNKDVASIAFFKFSTSVKPNTKDPVIIRMKEIIEKLLDSASVRYRKRKHRIAIKSSYYKAFASYFAISIINANK